MTEYSNGHDVKSLSSIGVLWFDYTNISIHIEKTHIYYAGYVSGVKDLISEQSVSRSLYYFSNRRYTREHTAPMA
jgi:hypothetical protein